MFVVESSVLTSVTYPCTQYVMTVLFISSDTMTSQVGVVNVLAHGVGVAANIDNIYP